MKRIAPVLLFFLFIFASCQNEGLRGKYVNIWTYHQENDAQSAYEFKRNGVVIQSLNIKPYEKLNFKGVNDSAEGKWEMEENTIIITLPEGSYEMELTEKGKDYIVLSMPSRNGEILKRKFIRE